MPIDFGAWSGQIRMRATESNSVVEININRFEAIGVGMVTLWSVPYL